MHKSVRLAGLFSLSILAACSREVTIKIGVVAPMSGKLAQFGKDITQGAQTAVDELNADNFLIDDKHAHFELVVEDDKADAGEGKAAAKRLLDKGVVAVFGDYNSGVSIAAAPVYAAAGVPQLSVSTNPKYTRSGWKTAFRITADDIQQSAALTHLVLDKLRAKSIYLLDDTTPFGVGLADEIKKLLAAKKLEVPYESINANGADYAAIAARIAQAKPDAVLFEGDEGVGVPLLKELRKAGVDAKFVAADAMCDASTVKHAEGNADSNFYCTVAGVPPSWLSAGIGFTQSYTAKYQSAPGAYATLAYDGIHVFSQAMREAGSSEPAKFLPVLAKGSFDGKIQGSVEFDEKGDLKDGTVVIYQSIGGQLTEQRNML